MTVIEEKAAEASRLLLSDAWGAEAMPPWAAIDYVQDAGCERPEAIQALRDALARWLQACRPNCDEFVAVVSAEAVRAIRRNNLDRAHLMRSKIAPWAFDEGIHPTDFRMAAWCAKAAIVIDLCFQLDPPPGAPEPHDDSPLIRELDRISQAAAATRRALTGEAAT